MNKEEAKELLAKAELISSAQEVQAAVVQMAGRIKETLRDENPVILCVMSGAVPFVGSLLPQLDFPLDFDYLHVSRYGASLYGREKLVWRSGPWITLKGRIVLVVDDILDEGLTLATICERVRQMGASRVWTAVLAEKNPQKEKPIKADFVGLNLPDRFVFGFGMDICGAWRNLPAIYARKNEKEDA